MEMYRYAIRYKINGKYYLRNFLFQDAYANEQQRSIHGTGPGEMIVHRPIYNHCHKNYNIQDLAYRRTNEYHI